MRYHIETMTPTHDHNCHSPDTPTNKHTSISSNPTHCEDMMMGMDDIHSSHATSAAFLGNLQEFKDSFAKIRDKATADRCAHWSFVEAATEGHMCITRHLIAVVDADATEMALREAAENGHFQMVKDLCDLPAAHRATTTRVSRDMVSRALRAAATNGHLPIVQYLCALFKARWAHSGDALSNALLAAVVGDHLPTVQYLCELPAERGVHIASNALQHAARNGNHAMVKYLCELPAERGVNPGANDSVALFEAATRGHLPVVQFLCELPVARGVRPAARNNIALRFAAVQGHLAVVQYLCELPRECGVRPTMNNSEVLQLAAGDGRLSVVKYLCELPQERRVDPAARNNRALVLADAGGHAEVARYLRTLLGCPDCDDCKRLYVRGRTTRAAPLFWTTVVECDRHTGTTRQVSWINIMSDLIADAAPSASSAQQAMLLKTEAFCVRSLDDDEGSRNSLDNSCWTRHVRPLQSFLRADGYEVVTPGPITPKQAAASLTDYTVHLKWVDVNKYLMG